MTNGIMVRNASGAALFNSLESRPLYHLSGITAINYTSLSDSNILRYFPITTKIQYPRLYHTRKTTDAGGRIIWRSIIEFTDMSGTAESGFTSGVQNNSWNYKEPMLISLHPHPQTRVGATGTSIYPRTLFGPTALTASYSDIFGAPATDPATYGMRSKNKYDEIVVEGSKKNLKVQTDISGNYLFTATATSGYSLLNGTFSGVPLTDYRVSPYYYDVVLDTNSFPNSVAGITRRPANIVFPKPLDKPPLIFIVSTEESAGYNYGLALYGFTKDAYGKYIGAIVICPSAPDLVGTGYIRGVNGRITTTTGPDVYAYEDERTPIDFTYYLVSDEEPLYTDPELYGLKILDASGNTVFSSKYIHPGFSSEFVEVPNRNYTIGGPVDFGQGDEYFMLYDAYSPLIQNRGSGEFKTGAAVCLNNFNAYVRIEEVQYNAAGYSNYGGDTIQTVVGTYLSVPQTTLDRMEIRFDFTFGFPCTIEDTASAGEVRMYRGDNLAYSTGILRMPFLHYNVNLNYDSYTSGDYMGATTHKQMILYGYLSQG